MSGLILKLRPREEVMINGVLVENGDRKTRIRVKSEGAHILRLRDAISAEDATTPLKRAHFAAQRAVAGLMAEPDAAASIRQSLGEARRENVAAGPDFDLLDALVQCQDFYQLMRKLSLATTNKSGGNGSQDPAASHAARFGDPTPAPARNILSLPIRKTAS